MARRIIRIKESSTEKPPLLEVAIIHVYKTQVSLYGDTVCVMALGNVYGW